MWANGKALDLNVVIAMLSKVGIKYGTFVISHYSTSVPPSLPSSFFPFLLFFSSLCFLFVPSLPDTFFFPFLSSSLYIFCTLFLHFSSLPSFFLLFPLLLFISHLFLLKYFLWPLNHSLSVFLPQFQGRTLNINDFVFNICNSIKQLLDFTTSKYKKIFRWHKYNVIQIRSEMNKTITGPSSK